VLKRETTPSSDRLAKDGRRLRPRFIGLTAVVAVAAVAGIPIAATASASGHKLKSILFVNPLPNYPAWKEIGACMGKEAKKLNIPFSQAGPAGENVNSQYMLSRLDQGIADKVGAVITFPLSAPQFDPVLEQARKAGLLVATVEGAGSTKNQNFDAGTSYIQFGQLAAKTISEKKGTQYVGFLTTSDTAPASTFVSAFTAAAKKYHNIQIVTSQYDQGNATNDVDIAATMMTAHPTLNMFVTNEGAATPGIIAAIKSAHKTGKVFLTTNSIYSGALAGIKSGVVYSTLLQDMCQIGTTPVQELAALAAGKHVPAEIDTPIRFATKSNVKQLTASGAYQ
jgi:ABC-type sugar transport system substrate-binding protein